MADGALILTADLPPDLHRWATALRTAHFPPERNHLEAHVTLFHALPAPYHAEIDRLLVQAARDHGEAPARIAGVMDLGRGTAIRIESAAILAVREEIAGRLHDLLTEQDRQRKRLHVTIQNKVEPRDAKALQRALAGTIDERAFRFGAMSLHRYLGGPWEKVKTYRFRG